MPTDDHGVRGYEITRNGVSLGIRDALSLYDPSLNPDTAYAFTVVAIDTAGQRSATASVSVGGGPHDTGTPPAPPDELTGTAYSSSNGELIRRRWTWGSEGKTSALPVSITAGAQCSWCGASQVLQYA